MRSFLVEDFDELIDPRDSSQPMATAGALEYQQLMSEGKNLSLPRCTSLKDLSGRRKQRENDREHVAEKLQRRPPKFNQCSQNRVFGRDVVVQQITLSLNWTHVQLTLGPLDWYVAQDGRFCFK